MITKLLFPPPPEEPEEKDDPEFGDEDDSDEDLIDDRPDCGCLYCYCMNKTIAGETCSDCLSGAHQG